MQLVHLHAHAELPTSPIALAIGNFDGVHRGHQVVLSTMLAYANTHHLTPAVLTFDPHPRELFNPAAAPIRIVPLQENVQFLRKYGVEKCYVASFDEAFTAMKAETFIHDLLLIQLNAKAIFTGNDFGFGHKRQGNVALLEQETRKANVYYKAVSGQFEGGLRFSSSLIRDALKKADMITVERILGRPYSTQGYVVHGDERARELGFPTANIAFTDRLQPKFGVYATHLAADGQIYPAIANWGIRPTFDKESPLLEVHVLDKTLELYNKQVAVIWLSYIREERTFSDISALKQQIAIDCEKAKQFHAINAS
jgi:riboflavin kinase/FMN adenylyltransferase